MTIQSISEKFEEGSINGLITHTAVKSLPWVEHSTFKGVFLKHIIKGEETGGAISCHLVRVNPLCCIDNHEHSGKLEVHEVLEGNGTCHLMDKIIPYAPGSIALIPADTNHKVIAGRDGLFLLAKFTPALL